MQTSVTPLIVSGEIETQKPRLLVPRQTEPLIVSGEIEIRAKRSERWRHWTTFTGEVFGSGVWKVAGAGVPGT